MRLKITFPALLISVIFLQATLTIHGQELKKKTIIGSYRAINGLPGKKIKYADGKEVHISPLVIFRKRLKLSRFGRFKETQEYMGGDMFTNMKGTWQLVNDTLILQPKTPENSEQILLVFTPPYYLQAIDTKAVYQKID